MDQKCAKKMWLHVEPHFFENYFVDKIQKFFKELILVFVVNRASSLNFTFIPNLKHCVCDIQAIENQMILKSIGKFMIFTQQKKR